MKQEHITSAKTYFVIFGWLVIFTVLEIAAVEIGIPRLGLVVFLIATAIAKMMLIALYFMHLRFESFWVWLLPGIPVLLGIAFVAALFPDIVFHLTLRM